MKKQTLVLIFSGCAVMSLGFISKRFLNASENLGDFITGIGVGFIFAALIMAVWSRRKNQ